MHNECRNRVPHQCLARPGSTGLPLRAHRGPPARKEIGAPAGRPPPRAVPRSAVEELTSGPMQRMHGRRILNAVPFPYAPGHLDYLDGYSGSRPGARPRTPAPPCRTEVPATMFPATWIERVPEFPSSGGSGPGFAPGKSAVPEFGLEISFGPLASRSGHLRSPEGVRGPCGTPVLDPSQVRVTCDGGILTIAGTREEIREHEEIDFPLRERTFGSFSRSIRLPAEADDGDVRTTFANGLLVVRVGKRSLGSGIGGWTHRSFS